MEKSKKEDFDALVICIQNLWWVKMFKGTIQGVLYDYVLDRIFDITVGGAN